MKKVFLGMSGGVDSSVSAKLLLDEGYQVEGVHFSFDEKNVGGNDAQAVCDYLGIKLHFVDFSKVFSQKVFQPFIEAYKNGLTPNLCVMCNKFIKFGALYDYAMENGADYVATGHYCSVKNIDGKTCLMRAADSEKDQTYFLNQVNELALAKTLFPLANLKKSDVRLLAEKFGLVTAHKKGSSDICLMGDKSFREFLQPYIPPKKGKIVSTDGEMVGEHNGLFNFTLGQRKGLGVGGKSDEVGRWFVVAKDATKNNLIVSHGSEELLFKKSLKIKNCNWIGFQPSESFSCLAKTRYRQQLQECKVEIISFGETNSEAVVTFVEPQRAVTPGQYCVFYDETKCLGGGIIV